MTTAIHLFDKEQDYTAYPSGQAVFKEGDVGEYMYVVKEGEIEILRDGRVLDTIGSGGVFGEMALIDDLPRSASAIAKTDSKLVLVNRRRFLFLVQETPFFAIQLMSIMADRLRRSSPRG
ncbi:MAG TPA: cyclic nucleotide-binding domain-containing protein [Opitutaceae bacterium]|nr:cyclic nucleotide-binding domain-containing protein [Opitutaceae bacterium]